MNHLPQGWGRPRDDIYGHYDHSYLTHPSQAPIQHTQQPAVTGTSVLAAKFKDGVVIAADNLASYGSLARFTDVHRLIPYGSPPHAVLGIGGDVSDMQHITRLLEELQTEEAYDNSTLNAKSLHTYLTKVMYNRRSKVDPLWNAILVAGFDEAGKPFLASVDLLGTQFKAPTLATGYGSMLAQPLLRKLAETEEEVAGVTLEAAVEKIKESLKVLFYRDARSMDRYSIAVVTKEHGVQIKRDEKLENQSWAFADRIKGYGTQVN